MAHLASRFRVMLPRFRTRPAAFLQTVKYSNSIFFKLYLSCYQPLATLTTRLGTPLHATFESGKELRSSQSSESTSPAGKRCFLGGTETSGGCDGLAKSSWVKVPLGPSTEETWNRLHNPETWLMLRRK